MLNVSQRTIQYCRLTGYTSMGGNVMSGLRIVCALLFALLCQAGIAGPSAIDGRVVGIQDGDTLTILDAGRNQHRIRLASIDAPE